MTSGEIPLLPHHRAFVDRFVAACRADERVVAAFLSGSYAQGTQDDYSDLDLGLVTTDAAYEEFCATRGDFIRQLGQVLFLEDFDVENNTFFILADDTEGELAISRESEFNRSHGGEYVPLLDKTGILAGAVFPWHETEQAEQTEKLRRLVYWFWHDLSHYITAMARGQLRWAYGQLDILRLMCVNLARLREDFTADLENYDKIEKAVPVEKLAALQPTFCSMERGAMLNAGFAIVQFYRDAAPALAEAHGFPYPLALERLMLERLERLNTSQFRSN